MTTPSFADITGHILYQLLRADATPNSKHAITFITPDSIPVTFARFRTDADGDTVTSGSDTTAAYELLLGALRARAGYITVVSTSADDTDDRKPTGRAWQVDGLKIRALPATAAMEIFRLNPHNFGDKPVEEILDAGNHRGYLVDNKNPITNAEIDTFIQVLNNPASVDLFQSRTRTVIISIEPASALEYQAWLYEQSRKDNA